MVTSNFLILSSSWDLEFVFGLVDARPSNVSTWLWIIGLGGGGKANTPGWAIYGVFFGDNLGNKGIIVLGCIFAKGTKVC